MNYQPALCLTTLAQHNLEGYFRGAGKEDMDVWNVPPDVEKNVNDYLAISRKLESKIDPETGEVLDLGELGALQSYRDALREALDGHEEEIALLYKNREADAKSIKESVAAQRARKQKADEIAESTKELLAEMLNGQKLKTGRVTCNFRTVKAVDLTDDFGTWAVENGHEDLLTTFEPKPNKNKIRDYLKAGGECPCAEIVERKSLSVK